MADLYVLRATCCFFQEHWKAVEFGPEISETDTLWKKDTRETRVELWQRTQEFLKWLSGRRETTIVVVSHGVWIEYLLQDHLRGQRVHNTDAFLCTLESNGVSFQLRPEKQIHNGTRPN